MFDWLQRALAPLRGPSAITLNGYLILIGLGTYLSFISNISAPRATPLLVLAVALIASLWPGLILLVAHYTYLRDREVRPARLSLVLATYLLVGLFRSGSASLLFADAGVIALDRSVLWSRIASGTFQTVIWCCITGLMIDRVRTLRSEHQQLLSAREQQISLQARSRELFSRDAAEFAQLAQQRLLPALSRIEDELNALVETGSAQEALRLAAEVREICDRDVRKFSHQLNDQEVEVAVASLPAPPTPFRWAVAQTLRESRLFPLVTTIATLLVVVPVSFVLFGIEGFVAVVPGTVLGMSLAAAISERLVEPLELRGWPRFTSNVGLIALAALVVTGFSTHSNLHQINPVASAQLVWTLPAGLFLVWISANMLVGSLPVMQRLAQELDSANQQLAAALRRTESEHRRLRRARARLLHGGVQGRLAAVGLALNLHSQTRDPQMLTGAIEQLHHARSELVDALAGGQLNSAGDSASLDDLLQSVTAAWQGLLEIELDVRPELAEFADGRSDQLEAISETVSECLVNAVRHGHARRARIAIEIEPRGRRQFVQVQVLDDGRLEIKEHEGGLGEKFLAVTGAERTIRRVADGTLVTVGWHADV